MWPICNLEVLSDLLSSLNTPIHLCTLAPHQLRNLLWFPTWDLWLVHEGRGYSCLLLLEECWASHCRLSALPTFIFQLVGTTPESCLFATVCAMSQEWEGYLGGSGQRTNWLEVPATQFYQPVPAHSLHLKRKNGPEEEVQRRMLNVRACGEEECDGLGML